MWTQSCDLVICFPTPVESHESVHRLSTVGPQDSTGLSTAVKGVTKGVWGSRMCRTACPDACGMTRVRPSNQTKCARLDSETRESHGSSSVGRGLSRESGRVSVRGGTPDSAEGRTGPVTTSRSRPGSAHPGVRTPSGADLLLSPSPTVICVAFGVGRGPAGDAGRRWTSAGARTSGAGHKRRRERTAWVSSGVELRGTANAP